MGEENRLNVLNWFGGGCLYDSRVIYMDVGDILNRLIAPSYLGRRGMILSVEGVKDRRRGMNF